MRRAIVPLLFGLIGAAILIGLGNWQMRRLAWKTEVLARIEAQIAAPPVALPAVPDPQADLYRAVTVTGAFTGRRLFVLASQKDVGAGHRVIELFRTEAGRPILVDRGFLPDGQRDRIGPPAAATVTGNLNWPDEVDGFTPEPDRARGLWFARDLPAMAAELGADPVLVVARTATDPAIRPWPVDTAGIPNDHLEYALTWYSLAAVWLGMTGLLLWRIRRRMD